MVIMDTLSIHFLMLKIILEVLNITKKENDFYINDQIRANRVLVIGPNGEQLGEKTKEDALILAEYAGFDLVMLNNNSKPPVCKLLDYNKFIYEKKKKIKEAKKNQKGINVGIKEYRLSPNIEKHDFDTKVKNVSKYLEKGYRIKVSIRFKGREMAHIELGEEVLYRFANALNSLSEIEQEPKLEDRNMLMLLVPKKK
jgi:translation initiation factor IF-3